MNKQDYVSLEVAKLLKEKYFDKRCEQRFVEKVSGTEREEWNNDLCAVCTVFDVICYPKPTLYEAQKWLRENGIYIEIAPHYSRKYQVVEYEYKITDYFDLLEKQNKGKKSKEYYEEYEQCLNNAIFEALKLI